MGSAAGRYFDKRVQIEMRGDGNRILVKTGKW